MDAEARFGDLLLRHSQEASAERRQAIEDVLWRDFGFERAVLVLDMSGFSALAQRHGIVHYLSMVRRMQLTAEPIVDGYAGTLVKFEADNCYAMFPDVAGAVSAARELHAAFAAANAETPDELDIRIACGIDHGRILVVPGRDFYGVPVNRACKLGEDLAAPGEILLTSDAMDRLPGGGDGATPASFAVSGIRIDAWRIDATAPPR
jgi:adenylate cyclase